MKQIKQEYILSHQKIIENHEPLSHLPLPLDDRHELLGFCSLESNRFEILTQSLARRKIPFQVIKVSGSQHILVPMPGKKETLNDSLYYRTTLVAHYDRFKGSPGANDNAAAIFQLLAYWEEMHHRQQGNRAQILFTDKEELAPDMKPCEQGSYLLASKLKSMGANNLLFVVLDMCGIGDKPVWGVNSHKVGLRNYSLRDYYAQQKIANLFKSFTGGRNYGFISDFSDDLGLLLAGYSAIQLSVLPEKEAEAMLSHSPCIPPAWKMVHSKKDKPEFLQGESFKLIKRILLSLGNYRFLLP